MSLKIRTLLLACFAIYGSAMAQVANKNVQMADAMRSNGKIFVVVAVIVTLFTGIVLYLISLDRKISRLEKDSGKD